MNKRIAVITSILALAICAIGCKSVYTYTTVKGYDANGNVVTQQKSKSKSIGFFVKSDSVNLQGEGSNTNYVTTNGVFRFAESKKFSVDKYTADPDEAAIEAGGKSAGNVIGAAGAAAIGK